MSPEQNRRNLPDDSHTESSSVLSLRSQDELRQLTQQLLRTRDEERRNVARELHESVGQTLAAVKMSLGRLRDALPESSPNALDILGSSLDLVEDAIRELRTISYLMHPPLLDEAGLASALRWYVKGFSERSGIAVSLQISDDFGRYSRDIETTIFRIVQEALTNVHRYSGSRAATIRIARSNGSVSAEVADQGCGLMPPDVGSVPPTPGVGILGMRERIQQLNGSFEIESAPGRGTTVRLVLPTDADGAGAPSHRSASKSST